MKKTFIPKDCIADEAYLAARRAELRQKLLEEGKRNACTNEFGESICIPSGMSAESWLRREQNKTK